MYDVEIFLTIEGELVVTAKHTTKIDNFVIQIGADKVEQLVGEFGSDYTSMAAHLKIMNRRMVLLNPRYL